MDLRLRWPILDELCTCAEQFPGVEVWAFGSMLRTQHPHDHDVLIIYTDPDHITGLYDMRLWEVSLPLLDIIAMTPDENSDYQFTEFTRAQRLHPPPPDSANEG